MIRNNLQSVLEKSRVEAARLYESVGIAPRVNHGRKVSPPVLVEPDLPNRKGPIAYRKVEFTGVDTGRKAVQKSNPGKRERAKMQRQGKASLIADNMAIPLKEVMQTSGDMYSRIAHAKDRSPFSVAHAPARGAGQGKERADKTKRAYGRFANR